MNNYGLTEERYNQMLSTCEGDESFVQEIVETWGPERCNKGYDVFDYDGAGLLEIEAIADVGAFDDEEAVRRAKADGIEIIPVSQLPTNIPDNMRWYGWVDTAENRAAISAYCS